MLLVVSAFIHGCYDLILSVELPTIAFYTYTIAMFVLAFRLLRKMSWIWDDTYRMKKVLKMGDAGSPLSRAGTYYEKVLSMLITYRLALADDYSIAVICEKNKG